MPDIFVIAAFEKIPGIETVGVAAIASEKAAVTVTTCDGETKLSLSELVNETVGADESIEKVVLSVPT